MDQTRKQARLEFADTPAWLIGTDGGAEPGLSKTLDLAAVALAAEQVGGAQRCLDSSVEYAKTRIQFGRPIGSFQAIKHKCADMLLEVESAKSAAYYAGWAAAEDSDELPVVASLAKSYCSEAYFHAAAETIQIHGGIGFTWEHPAHLYFKRAKSSELHAGRPLLPPGAAGPAHRHLSGTAPAPTLTTVVPAPGPHGRRARPRPTLPEASDMRKYLAFLLLGILTLVGAGRRPPSASCRRRAAQRCSQAVKNTLGASNYTEDLVEKTPQGNQTAHLVYQAPDRLGGWLLSAGRKTYLYIIGTTEYIASASRPSAPIAEDLLHPADHRAPRPSTRPTPTSRTTTRASPRAGSVTTVTLTQGSQTETLTYTVTGNYVSAFNAVDARRHDRPRHLARRHVPGRRRCPRATRPRPSPPTQG